MGRRAFTTRPEEFHDVFHVAESVLLADPARPPLDGGGVQFDRSPAGPADEVMVVTAGAAPPVDGLAVRGPQHVDVAVVRELLQRPVHGGQADAVAVRAQPRVQLLRALELAGRLQRRPDGAALPGLDPGLGLGMGPLAALRHLSPPARSRTRPAARRSVLVVLGAVRRVPVTVVDVVDVVAVHQRLVPAPRAVLVPVPAGVVAPPGVDGGPGGAERHRGQEDGDRQQHDRRARRGVDVERERPCPRRSRPAPPRGPPAGWRGSWWPSPAPPRWGRSSAR